MRFANWLLSAPIVLATSMVIYSQGCSSPATDAPLKCKPGDSQFCRCADLSDGETICQDDGHTFSACDCGQIQPDRDSGFIDVDTGPIDAGHIDLPESCAKKIAILAGPGNSAATPDAGGAPTAKTVFAWSFLGNNAVTLTRSDATGILSPATLVGTGKALMGVFRTRFDFMLWTKFADTWSSPSYINAENAKSATRPSLFTTPEGARLVYLGVNRSGPSVPSLFDVGYTDAAGWDSAPANANPKGVATPDGGTPPYRYVEATTLSATAALGILVDAKTNALYTYTRSSSGWSTAVRVGTFTLSLQVDPALVALDSTFDALAVYTDINAKLYSVARARASGSWAPPVALGDTAVPGDRPSLAAMPGGRALATWLRADKSVYYSVYDPSKTPQWSMPAEMVSGVKFASSPQLTPGKCGGADATVAYADESGNVSLQRFSGGAFTAPILIEGITNAQWVGVGELP